VLARIFNKEERGKWEEGEGKKWARGSLKGRKINNNNRCITLPSRVG
jgi:hypothetical protein